MPKNLSKSRPKMTDSEKLEQNKKSRFIRIIPAPEYQNFLNHPDSVYKYDEKGRRVK